MRWVPALAALTLASSLAGCADGADGGDGTLRTGDAKEPAPVAATESSSWIEGESASEIVGQTAQAMRGLADVTYRGEATFPFPAGAERVRMTTAATADGSCETVMRVASGATVTVRVLGPTGYLRADLETLTAEYGMGAGDAELLAGRWIEGPAAEIMPGCSTEAVSHTRSVDLSTCDKGEKGEVDGTPTLSIRCRTTFGSTTMQVGLAEGPVVLAVRGVDDGNPFRMTMAEYNTGLEIRRPPRRDVIDLRQLE